jgi:hypothetical protein
MRVKGVFPEVEGAGKKGAGGSHFKNWKWKKRMLLHHQILPPAPFCLPLSPIEIVDFKNQRPPRSGNDPNASHPS